MPLQNRVTPTGEIIATPARGTLMGNRGCLHDGNQRVVREFKVRRWLICRMDFRGRHHQPMGPGLYTSLFFLDEATALAAGHRPCAECRRDRYDAYRRGWAAALGVEMPSAGEMDDRLHEERRGPRPTVRVSDLPAGAMVRSGSHIYLVAQDRLLPWEVGGYGAPLPLSAVVEGQLLTPPATLAILAGGYEPLLHPTADQQVLQTEGARLI